MYIYIYVCVCVCVCVCVRASTRARALSSHMALTKPALPTASGAVALVAVGNLDSSIRPGELVVGGGFLGDLPHGGQTGHQAVRSFKELAHETRSNKALQSSLAHSMMGNGNVDSKKAKAIAAAAAEIAKVLKVPSARDLVLGKKGAEMSYGPSPRQVQKEVHSKKHKLAGWLKTPSSEGEFKYHHTAVHVKNGCPKCHNQVQCTCACCTCTHTLTLSSLCIHASIFPVLNHFFTHVHPDGLGIGCARME